MMGKVIPFDFEGASVRVLDREGSPWFVLADVCRVLEIANPSNVAARLDDDEKTTLHNTEGQAGCGAQVFTIINESGLYSLVLTSRKASAKRFKKWVTAEVLPAIRRTGRYVLALPKRAEGAEDLWEQPVQVLNTQIRMIAEARAVFGAAAARQLWRASGLPQVEGDPEETELFDPGGCLAHLLRYAAAKHSTIGDLVDAVADGGDFEVLAEIGLLVSPAGHPGKLAVAERSATLSAIYRDTPWCEGGWTVGLMGLPGARKVAELSFNGRKRRAVLVPMACVNAVPRFERRTA